MNSIKVSAVSALITLFLAACGGSNGGNSAGIGVSDALSTTTIDTVISGIATKGPITGTINFYSLNANGSRGSLFISTKIDNGKYTANIGKHAGPVLIEVTGSYIDEATGATKYITDDAPMRAALSDAAGTITVPVTPLTELAVQKAGVLTGSAIDAGNKLISDIFKFDIIATQPVAPISTALSGSSVTQNQKDYTLALAALSQLSSTRRDTLFSTTLATVANGISFRGIDNQTISNFQKAVTDFMSNPNNKTGITDASTTNLVTLNGGTTVTYRLAISPSSGIAIEANAIKGIQFEIVIPAGLTVRYNHSYFSNDSTKGETLSGIVTASTLAAATQPTINAMYNASSGVLSFALLSSIGISAGDFATITCDALPGWPVPSATAFSIRNIKAINGSAATLGNVKVAVMAN
jgi:hypothetical protein